MKMTIKLVRVAIMFIFSLSASGQQFAVTNRTLANGTFGSKMDTTNHYVLNDREIDSKEAFLDSVKVILKAKGPKARINVNVWGFCNSYFNALSNTEKIVRKKSEPNNEINITFSFPSLDKLNTSAYKKDRASAIQSSEAFKELVLLLEPLKFNKTLIVHSVGTEIVLPALTDSLMDQVFNQVVLFAPDLAEDRLAKLKIKAENTLIFVNRNDYALLIAPLIEGEKRLGICKYPPINEVNVKVLNAKKIFPFKIFISHSYWSKRCIIKYLHDYLNEKFQEGEVVLKDRKIN